MAINQIREMYSELTRVGIHPGNAKWDIGTIERYFLEALDLVLDDYGLMRISDFAWRGGGIFVQLFKTYHQPTGRELFDSVIISGVGDEKWALPNESVDEKYYLDHLQVIKDFIVKAVVGDQIGEDVDLEEAMKVPKSSSNEDVYLLRDELLGESLELNDPIYTDREKWPKYNVLISPLSAHGSDAGKVLRKRLPNWTKEQHIAVAKKWETEAKKVNKQYIKALDDAAQETWGRDFKVTDYRISAIGSDEFSEKMKKKLRALAQRESAAKKAAFAHEEAAKGFRKKAQEDVLNIRDELLGERRPSGDSSWSQAVRLGQGGLGLHLNKNPNGTWSFVGSVPIEFGYERRDGKEMSDDEKKEVADMVHHSASGGPNFRRVYSVRVFKSPKEALAAAKKGGYKVVDDEKKEDVGSMSEELPTKKVANVLDQIKHFSIKGGRDGYRIFLSRKDQEFIRSNLAIGKWITQVIDKSFDSSDEAHDWGQKIFKNATVDIQEDVGLGEEKGMDPSIRAVFNKVMISLVGTTGEKNPVDWNSADRKAIKSQVKGRKIVELSLALDKVRTGASSDVVKQIDAIEAAMMEDVGSLVESDAVHVVRKIMSGIKVPKDKPLRKLSTKERKDVVKQLAKNNLAKLRAMQDGLKKAFSFNYDEYQKKQA